jgi:flagellar hook assembly protein FlgD
VHFTTLGEQKLEVDQSYFYPNPAEGAQGQYLYNLTRSAKSAQVSIYSVSGRRVRVLTESGPLLPGLHAFLWNLQDEAGDQVSNGVYLLVLRVNGDDNSVVTPEFSPERVVVTR